jgi:hypothetical protein
LHPHTVGSVHDEAHVMTWLSQWSLQLTNSKLAASLGRNGSPMQVPDQAAPHAASPVADGTSSILQQLQGALLGNGLRQTAQGINWCESDYAVSPFVAEWWNTISNLAFLVARPTCPPLHIAAITDHSIRRWSAASVFFTRGASLFLPRST